MRKHLELFPEDALMRGVMKKVEGCEPWNPTGRMSSFIATRDIHLTGRISG
jgi:hypothetical protein